MNKDWKYYKFKRCEKALVNDEDYQKKEREGAEPAEIQEIVESACYDIGYADGFKAAMKIMSL